MWRRRRPRGWRWRRWCTWWGSSGLRREPLMEFIGGEKKWMGMEKMKGKR
jgi:hypothetical protein